MITVAKLRVHTVKDLGSMAKQKGIPGWHSMRKDDLVQALVRKARADAAKKARKVASVAKTSVAKNGSTTKSRSTGKVGPAKATSVSSAENGKGGPKAKSKPRSRHTEKRIRQIKAQMTRLKDLTFNSTANGNGCQKDRLVVMVRDAYWLHAYWELTRQSVERARVALGQHWHAARPILRVSEVASDGTTSTARKLVRDIEIHGGVNNWYVDVQDPPNSYQLDIGYLASDGRLLGLARSNVVTTPQSDSTAEVDGNWSEVAKDFDRIYALSGGYDSQGGNGDMKDLFEERLRRPMGSPMVTRFGMGAQAMGENRRKFAFDVDAELVVHGVANPDSHVTLKGEPIRLQADGTFSVRFNLPERRHVLPVVASSHDGVEQRTIVLAVERNTKIMEPVIREPDA